MSTLKFGLLGWPVSHSVSPQMQQAGFRAIGLDASYELLPVPPDDFPAKVRELHEQGFRGWNVTVPHKRAMMQLVDTAEPAARHAQSVNTVLVRDGQLHGYSTDGYGLDMAIQEAFGISARRGTFVFWGTGGAARATSIHFAIEGATAITLVNRTLSTAQALAEQLRAIAPACNIRTFAPDELAPLAVAFAEADIIFQCTSVGLKPDDPCAIPFELIASSRRIMDMIYHPTRLLDMAVSRGCAVADGRRMLLHQGARSFTIWTEEPAPVEVMRRALDNALGRQ